MDVCPLLNVQVQPPKINIQLSLPNNHTKGRMDSSATVAEIHILHQRSINVGKWLLKLTGLNTHCWFLPFLSFDSRKSKQQTMWTHLCEPIWVDLFHHDWRPESSVVFLILSFFLTGGLTGGVVTHKMFWARVWLLDVLNIEKLITLFFLSWWRSLCLPPALWIGLYNGYEK